MGFDYRRLLIPLEKPEIDGSLCYGCYGGCPGYCSNIYSSTLQPPPPPPAEPAAASQSHRFSTILAIMLGVLGLALVFLSYLTIRGYRIRSRRNSTSNNSQPLDRFRDDENQGPVLDHPIWYIRTVGFPQSVIDSIAVFKYVKGEGIIEGSDCSICLNEFRQDESLRLLPKCSHAFHLPCVDTWLRSHKNCPVCRAPVMNAAADDTSSQVVVDVSTGTRSWDSGVMTEGQNLQQASESGDRGNGVEEAPDSVREVVTGVSDRHDMLEDDDDVPLKNSVVLSGFADYNHHSIDQPLSQEPLRRSVSMDFLSASSSVHHHPMNSSFNCKKQDEGCSELSVIEEKQHDSDIIDRKELECKKSSSQKGPVLMLKRSFSFSGRSLWKNHSKSVESISIPEV